MEHTATQNYTSTHIYTDTWNTLPHKIIYPHTYTLIIPLVHVRRDALYVHTHAHANGCMSEQIHWPISMLAPINKIYQNAGRDPYKQSYS